MKVSSKATCLTRDAFHQATVPKECYPIEGQYRTIYRDALTIGVVIDEVEPLLVINSS